METILMLGFLLLIFALFALFHSRGKVLTGSAKVISRRAEAGNGGGSWRSSNWNHLVTFQLGDGSTIELYTGKEEYTQLTEGLRGQLVWQHDNFLSFDTDIT